MSIEVSDNNGDDIIMWPSGYWCYRRDFDLGKIPDRVPPGSSPRVIKFESREWEEMHGILGESKV